MLKVLLVALLITSTLASILVKKNVLEGEVVKGKPVAVNVKIYNTGSTPIYDIVVDDSSWSPEEFEFSVGLKEASFDRLAPGANLTHTHVVVPKFTGYFSTNQATVSFRATPGKGPYQTVLSTSQPRLYSLEKSEREKRSSPHLKEWFIFIVLALASVMLPFGIWFHLQVNFDNGVPKVARAKKL